MPLNFTEPYNGADLVSGIMFTSPLSFEINMNLNFKINMAFAAPLPFPLDMHVDNIFARLVIWLIANCVHILTQYLREPSNNDNNDEANKKPAPKAKLTIMQHRAICQARYLRCAITTWTLWVIVLIISGANLVRDQSSGQMTLIPGPGLCLFAKIFGIDMTYLVIFLNTYSALGWLFALIFTFVNPDRAHFTNLDQPGDEGWDWVYKAMYISLGRYMADRWTECQARQVRRYRMKFSKDFTDDILPKLDGLGESDRIDFEFDAVIVNSPNPISEYDLEGYLWGTNPYYSSRYSSPASSRRPTPEDSPVRDMRTRYLAGDYDDKF